MPLFFLSTFNSLIWSLTSKWVVFSSITSRFCLNCKLKLDNGSKKPVRATKGTEIVSGIPLKEIFTENLSSKTTKFLNWCCRTIVISLG